jgi:hypothetical protein
LVFISYSHEDRQWLRRLLQHLAVLKRAELLHSWSDEQISIGATWEVEIKDALSRAKVAVLLVSPAFLDSDFIWTKEMPHIVEHRRDGMQVLPLVIRGCAWRLEEAVRGLQASPEDGRPLATGSDAQIDVDLANFAYRLAKLVGSAPPAIQPGAWSGRYRDRDELLLTIDEVEGEVFKGRLEYVGTGTVSGVEGRSLTEEAQIEELRRLVVRSSGTRSSGGWPAVTFRETGVLQEGAKQVWLEGEYRALVSPDAMTGSWYSDREGRKGDFTFHPAGAAEAGNQSDVTRTR